MIKYVVAALAAAALLAPLAAEAQGVPSYAQPTSSYAGDENIHGRIATFDGGFNLTVRDERGFVDNVHMHQGTIINPTGITLEAGMVVSILGYNAGSYLEANEIDTPYTLVVGVPYWADHPWWYYGPTVSLGFFFGSPGWWHGGYFHGGFHYVGGARAYPAPLRPVYRGGAFQGRAYVAPPGRGGYVGHGPSGRGGGGGPSGHGGGGGPSGHGGGGGPSGHGGGGRR